MATADMERDRFLTAEQARDYLVDRVIASHELDRKATGFGGRRGGGGD